MMKKIICITLLVLGASQLNGMREVTAKDEGINHEHVEDFLREIDLGHRERAKLTGISPFIAAELSHNHSYTRSHLQEPTLKERITCILLTMPRRYECRQKKIARDLEEWRRAKEQRVDGR